MHRYTFLSLIIMMGSVSAMEMPKLLIESEKTATQAQSPLHVVIDINDSQPEDQRVMTRADFRKLYTLLEQATHKTNVFLEENLKALHLIAVTTAVHTCITMILLAK